VQVISVQSRDIAFVIESREVQTLKKVVDEARIISFEVADEQGGVQRPIVVFDEMDLTQRAVAAGHNAGP
jgi:hypothetical protein